MARAVVDDIELRDPSADDFAIFFAHRQDEVSSRMAAFGTSDGSAADYEARMKEGIASGGVTLKSISHSGRTLGMVGSFVREGNLEITYGIGREHWGKGIATAALKKLLALTPTRPVHASAAADNVGSLRVLEKCGFSRTGTAKSYSPIRNQEIEEVFFVLR